MLYPLDADEQIIIPIGEDGEPISEVQENLSRI